MQYRKLGNSGLDASAVGLGCWAIGGWMWGGSEEKESIQTIHRAIDEGINLLDTAPIYGFGRSEEIVGRAIRDRRDRVVLATKCGLIWDQQRGDFFFTSNRERTSAEGSIQVYRCLAPDTIRVEVESSLQRLGVDHIDLLQTHWQETTTPIPETMETLMALKAEGKIRAIGCSNATPEQMDAYRSAGELDTDQERYSMLDRKQERSNLPYVDRHGIAFLAYSPLEQGLLTGAVGPARTFDEGDLRRDNPCFSIENRRRVQTLLESFAPIAEAHGVTLGQLTIAWTLTQTGCSHALVGARTPEQAAENAAAGRLKLSAAELERMTAALESFEIAAQ